MLDLRTGLRPREDLAPLPPPVGEIVARARRRQLRRRLVTTSSVLGAVALLAVVVSNVGAATDEPDARTGPAAEPTDTTIPTTNLSSSSTTATTAPPRTEEAPAPTTPTTDTAPPATMPPTPPTSMQAPPPAPPVVIQDTERGTGVGQVEFSDGWNACTHSCAKAPDGIYQWTEHPGSHLTLRFTGTRVVLFGVKEPWSHVATVAIDGGAPMDVDFYEATATVAVEVFRSSQLDAGTHTLVLTMTERRHPASTGGNAITFDRAEVTGG